MDMSKLIAANQRRIILKLLSKQADYKASNYDLYLAFGELNVSISVDKLTTEIQWLIEQGFITRLDGDLIIVRLTDRGLDIVKQNTSHPDIETPLPSQQ